MHHCASPHKDSSIITSVSPCACVGGCLTRLRVEPAGVEEVSGEVDVDVAEEKQHVASLPGPGANVQPPSPRKLLVQLQQSVVFKTHFPAVTQAQREDLIRGTRRHSIFFFFYYFTQYIQNKKKSLFEPSRTGRRR